MIVKLDKEPEVVESISEREFEDDNRKDKLGKKEDKNFNDEKGENGGSEDKKKKEKIYEKDKEAE